MLRFMFTVLFASSLAHGASGQTFYGAIRVIDADTIRVADIKVRLHGIDAPEVAQTCELADGRPWFCGKWASDRVRVLYQGALAKCDQLDIDKYGRVVAKCRVDGRDIGARLVRDGLAEAFRRYSLDYVGAEEVAIGEGMGLWRGRVQAPAAFRAVRYAPQPAPDANCAIKGNISANGRIYHLPGQAFYDRTNIRVTRGEHWFCSESEARTAGWRLALR